MPCTTVDDRRRLRRADHQDLTRRLDHCAGHRPQPIDRQDATDLRPKPVQQAGAPNRHQDLTWRVDDLRDGEDAPVARNLGRADAGDR